MPVYDDTADSNVVDFFIQRKICTIAHYVIADSEHKEKGYNNYCPAMDMKKKEEIMIFFKKRNRILLNKMKLSVYLIVREPMIL